MWLLSNKLFVEDSGLLEGFCDCHCHLLPGVDDGVKRQQEALQILKTWERLGMKEVWLTPHIMEDIPNEPVELKKKLEEVKAAYKGTIELHLAAENMMDGLFTKRMATGNLLTIGQEGTKLLVETSYYNPPMNMNELIDEIKAKGYTPILAHPERYHYMEMRDYKHWKERGVKLQLNLPSLVGAYGPEVMKKAERLLERSMYDYCGTDTHSMNQVDYFTKSPISKKILKKAKKLIEEQEV